MIEDNKSFTDLTIIQNMPNASQYEASILTTNEHLNEAAMSISGSLDEPAIVTVIGNNHEES